MAKDGFLQSGVIIKVESARTVHHPKKYVVYSIKVRKGAYSLDDHQVVIERRYSEFLELFTKLREEFPEIVSSIAFPKKAIVGNFSPQVVSHRRVEFEALLLFIMQYRSIRESPAVIRFLQEKELSEALQLVHDRKYDTAVTQLETSFLLVNKLLTDRHPAVLRTLCLLVACCDASGHTKTCHYANTAIVRYETVSDTDSLRYYVPLLQLSVRRLRDCEALQERLFSMKRRGIKVDGCPSLLDAVLADFKHHPSL